MMKNALIKVLILISMSLSIVAFSGPQGGGHGPGGHGPGGRGPGGHGPCWGGWGSGGKALFWTDFGLQVGALVLGTVVTYLPPERTVVVVGGTTYYNYAGTYFSSVPESGGYAVVNPPSTTVVVPAAQAPTTTVVVQSSDDKQAATETAAATPQTKTATTSVATADPGKYDVYLSNGNGTFTVIPLTKTATGFLGPQGEFYSDHPTLEQLNERYMKK